MLQDKRKTFKLAISCFYMNNESDDQVFASDVARQLRLIHPEYNIEYAEGRSILVNGRRLDLENLYRMIRHEPERGDEITESYLSNLFSENGLQILNMSFDFARPRIMPRVQPDSIFQHLTRDMVAHTPYVNNTVIVYVTDFPRMTVSLTTEHLVRWRLSIDEVDDIAGDNLANYAPDLEVQFIESKDGGRAAILGKHDGYDAARLRMSGLYEKLSPELGRDFYVATPARDIFVALSREPEPFVKRIKDRVEKDFERLPYPITKDFFYFTRDGVAGTIDDSV